MQTFEQEQQTGTADACSADYANSNERPGSMALEAINLLPPPRLKRWVPQRKADVVSAVRGGFLSLDKACERYAMSVEEYLTWQHAIDLFGLAGLRANKAQQRRSVKDGSADGQSAQTALQPPGGR